MNYSHRLSRLALALCAFSFSLVIFNLAPTSAVQAQTRRASRVPTIYDAQRAVEKYVDSGEFDRDRAIVVTAARRWLDKRVKTASKPAIVVDIDETALDNSEESRINRWVNVANGPCDLEKGPCGHRAWQALARSKAIASTLALVKHARELGVAVFFISGRPERLREATERNLREQGYEWTKVILEPNDTRFPSAADFKAPERRKITEAGYSILLNLGDQESDLTGGFAERTFKLPNPIYFVK
jgi:predicted secreted acid phosphatase